MDRVPSLAEAATRHR